MLGERLRQARLASGMSLRELAAKLRVVTSSAISKYELGEDVPRQSVLLALARTLSIPPDRLLSSPSVSLTVVEFRKRKSLPESKSEQIQARVMTELESYIDLAELLAPMGLEQYDSSVASNKTITSLDEVDKYAVHLRADWNLGLDPIRDVIETVEATGVKVITIDADPRFDELACVANGKYPVVVVKDLEPGKGDRQRFNVLHGLGHLLLCPGEGVDKEKMCNRFAGAMLAPSDAVFKKLGKKRRDLDLDYELPKLKEEFGMSISAWIYRASDLRIIDNSTRARLFLRLNQRQWRVNEPVEIPLEVPSRFRLMVSRARAEGIITPVKAASLLKQFRRKVLSPLNEVVVPSSAFSDYLPDGPLDLWGDLATEAG